MPVQLIRSETFDRWLAKLADKAGKAKILVRLDRLQRGNFGDIRPVGGGISEMRVDFGPGYRVYLKQQGTEIILLLCGGDKGTQQRDIRAAKEMVKQWKPHED